MKKLMLKILVPIMIIILGVGIFAGCKKHEEEGKDEEITSNGITAEVTEALLVTGESFTLGYEFSPKEAQSEVEFSSENDCITVDKEGKITAVKPGSTIVTVKEKKGDKYAQCKVVVGDIIVDASVKPSSSPTLSGGITLSRNHETLIAGAEEDKSGENGNQEDGENKNEENKEVQKNYGGKLGETLFATIGEAMNHAVDGYTFVIKSGTYDENVKISKSVSLNGVQKPQIRNIEIEENLTVSLNNLNVVDDDYPMGSSARILVKSGVSLKIEKCLISTMSNEKLSGGFGILAEKQVKSLELSNNTISNLRYGVYVCPTDGEITIKNNDFSNLEVGVGVDVRQENSNLNYPTKGEIDGNTYNEVVSDTQFLHYGDNYEGDFGFKDNEKDNASSDEGNNGGSGLTE